MKDADVYKRSNCAPLIALVVLTLAYLETPLFLPDWRWIYLLVGAMIIVAMVILIVKWKAMWAVYRRVTIFYSISLLIIGLSFFSSVASYPYGAAVEVHQRVGCGVKSFYLDQEYGYYHMNYYADPVFFLDGLIIMLKDFPCNAGTNCMALIFGRVPGSYDGPFPTFDEATKLLDAQGGDVRIGEPGSYKIYIDDQEVTLRKRHWLELSQAHDYQQRGVLSGVVVSERCVLLGGKDDVNGWDELFVIDPQKGDVVSRLRRWD